MSQFEQAIAYLESSLRDMHTRGLELRAPALSLAQLAAAARANPMIPAVRESEPEASAPATLAPEIPRTRTRPAATTPAPAAPVKVADDTVPSRLAPATGTKAERLAAMRDPVLACTKCPALVKFRTQVVFGVGNPEAELMFVGEAPGEQEDYKGEPFVGPAGQLLTKIIVAMGLKREDVYIANVLKCRPDMPAGMPGNRKPTAPEMQTCKPYLLEQIEIIQPRVLVALGGTAMEGLIGETSPMNRLRGRWFEFHCIPLMATYHPSYLLRNQAMSEKRKVWEDMLLVMEKLEMPISEKQRNFFLRGS